jgi:hypothetical protein
MSRWLLFLFSFFFQFLWIFSFPTFLEFELLFFKLPRTIPVVGIPEGGGCYRETMHI